MTLENKKLMEAAGVREERLLQLNRKLNYELQAMRDRLVAADLSQKVISRSTKPSEASFQFTCAGRYTQGSPVCLAQECFDTRDGDSDVVGIFPDDRRKANEDGRDPRCPFTAYSSLSPSEIMHGLCQGASSA